jgi:hypothetical protein
LTRHQLQEMHNRVAEAQAPRLAQITQNFIDKESVPPLNSTEIEEINRARQEIERGEYYTHKEVCARFE